MILNEDYNDSYYHLSKDILEYPDAVVYIIWSRRGPGKTYSALLYPYHRFKTAYIKRTNKDVNTICTYQGDIDHDPSPWKPINRDRGINVKPRLIEEGMGAFYDANEKGEPVGNVIQHIFSFAKMKILKGMDFSDVEWMIFDEFVPQPGEVVKHAEGEMLLNLYMTLNRDRQKRGRPPMKLILLANSDEVSTYITNELEVVDTMVDMQIKGVAKLYDPKRKILFHHITEEEFPFTAEELTGMYEVMRGTAWASKSYDGEFASNDFSNIIEMGVKNMRCLYHLHYRRQRDAYIYLNKYKGTYYMTDVKGQAIQTYNLDRETEQKKWYLEHGIDLKRACIDDQMKFKKYSYYDLIMNFTKFYDV